MLGIGWGRRDSGRWDCAWIGASEDFALGRLPRILRSFAHRHPLADLEMIMALSVDLRRMLDAGELDRLMAKRQLAQAPFRLSLRRLSD